MQSRNRYFNRVSRRVGAEHLLSAHAISTGCWGEAEGGSEARWEAADNWHGTMLCRRTVA